MSEPVGAADSHSQHGEDRYILNLLDASDPKWVVDVGANDGQSWSNSRLFGRMAYELLLIEPMPDYVQRCRTLYHGYTTVRFEQAAVGEPEGEVQFFVNEDAATDLLAMRSSLSRAMVPSEKVREITVSRRPLHALLQKHDWPPEYALLTIDAEGADFDVVRSAGLDRWRPRVVCVEDEVLGRQVSDYLTAIGYVAEARLGPNGIYRLPR